MEFKFINKIKAEEYSAAAVSFIYCFSILAAYYIMRPIRDQLAVEAGSAQLPWFFAYTFLATLGLTPLFSWLVSKWPRHIVMPIVYLFFIACQFVFIFLFNDHDLLTIKNLGLLFFVWVSVFNLFVISVFWSFMADIWDDLQARRLFPIIALGGTAGALAGPVITKTLVEILGLSNLLLVSIAFLVIALACIIYLGKWAQKYSSNRKINDNEAPIHGGMLDGLKQIFSNHFIAMMSIMMLLSDAIGTIAYVLVTDYIGIAYPKDAIAQTRFAANMDLTSNIIQIILQLTATRWILVRYGAGTVFALCSTIVVIASLLVALSPNPYSPIIGIFPLIAIVLILTRSLAHSMIQAARESLYTLVPRNLRYKGKNAVDTVVWRAGDVISLLSINAFRSLGVNVAGFGLIWAVLAAISGIIGWRLANRAERKEFEN